MLKKIGILTFHAAHNYGSMLQAYALQTYLERLGCQTVIINMRNPGQKAVYGKPSRHLTKKNLKAVWANPYLFVRNLEKWDKFEQFMKTYFHLSREHFSIVESERIINQELGLDAIITGGDQIWNLECLDLSLAYILPFETPGIRRIAYSPSLGDGEFWVPQHYGPILKQTVEGYDFPSVREDSASAFLSGLLGRRVPAVPDPTLLLERQDYETLAGNDSLVKGDYVFYYSPQPDRQIAEYVSRFAHVHGFKVVSPNKGLAKEEKCFISYNNSGPSEFLNLLKNAAVVCGRSFHLAVFSMIFHKPFFAVGKTEGMRIKSFLAPFGLADRYFMTSDNERIEGELPPIDWEKTDRTLLAQRRVGEAFLENALKDNHD